MTEEKQEKEKPKAAEKPAGVKVKASPLFLQCRFVALPTGLVSKADFRTLKGGGICEVKAETFGKHGKFFIEVK